jgi:hypothetical protein
MAREKAIYLPLTSREKQTLQTAAKAEGMNQREYLRSMLWALEGAKQAERKTTKP